jgi:hypothetical protein
VSHNDLTSQVNKALYKGGCTLFAFDLSPDGCNGFHFHPKRTGTIDLNMRFNDDLDGPIYVIVMATYDSCLTIDQYLNIDTNSKV